MQIALDALMTMAFLDHLKTHRHSHCLELTISAVRTALSVLDLATQPTAPGNRMALLMMTLAMCDLPA